MDTVTAYCRTLAERHDYDRAVLAMAAPAAARPHLWTVIAFNHEIARTREVVTDAHAGLIRLQWWRDTLDAHAHGGPCPAHDVARALFRGFDTGHLKPDLLQSLIDARMRLLQSGAPANLEAMASQAGACNTPLLKSFCTIADEDADETTITALAAAYGLCGALRALPFAISRNTCTLPRDLLAALPLAPEQFYEAAPSPALFSVIETIAQHAKNLNTQATPRGRIVRAQQKMTALYLRRLERAGHNPFTPVASGPVPFLGIRILWF